MTFRLPRWVLLIAGMVFAAGVFLGIAYAVAWNAADARADRIGRSLKCTDNALRAYIDADKEARDDRPNPPDRPSSRASLATWDRYDSDFSNYENRYDTWLRNLDAISETYETATRTCLDKAKY